MNTLLEIILSPYFWKMLVFVVVGSGLLGFATRFTVKNMDVLFWRRLVRTVLIVVIIFSIVDALLVPRAGAQDLIRESIGWSALVTQILWTYFGAWALVVGAEKRWLHPLIFFNQSFGTKIECDKINDKKTGDPKETSRKNTTTKRF